MQHLATSFDQPKRYESQQIAPEAYSKDFYTLPCPDLLTFPPMYLKSVLIYSFLCSVTIKMS